MFKKLIMLLVVIFSLSLLGGCGVDNTVAVTPVTWEGNWSNENGSMIATVAEGTITVNIVDTTQESSSLFWKGTFPNTGGSWNITSAGDRTALDSSILGSQETSKDFTYDGKTLYFSFSMMGTTKIIHLKKEA